MTWNTWREIVHGQTALSAKGKLPRVLGIGRATLCDLMNAGKIRSV
jgi:hypothetical protein